MISHGKRQNFKWRPNTYDSTTLARYDQEAEHWVRAFQNATRPKDTFAGTMNILGLIFSLIFSVLTVFVLLIINLIKWLKK